MNKTAKIISVFLAVVMALSVLPFAAFAAEEDEFDSSARVAGWKANYGLLLAEIFDNAKYTSWQYVEQNKKALTVEQDLKTTFALYDGAWENGLTNNLSQDNAEKILLGLTEKAEYAFEDGYVDEIISALKAAEDVNSFIQKVNQYANIEVFQSSGWSTTFAVIGNLVEIGEMYQTYRDRLAEAYARILTVQMANAYYIDLLGYIKENSASASLKAAASKLLTEFNSGDMETALQQIAKEVAEDLTMTAVETAASAAMDSNVYTAAAKTVYGVGKTAADFLWNAGDTYKPLDTVLTAYDFQSDVSKWAKAALNGDDDAKALVAVSYAITARDMSEDFLYQLKLSENEGVINKIKNKLYGTVYNNIEVSRAALATMNDMFFALPVADMKTVKRVLTIYCPVKIEVLDAANQVLFTVPDGVAKIYNKEQGVFKTVYSEYAKTYHKIAFLYDTYRIRLVATAEGYVTLIMDALNGDAIEDWSFTDRKVVKDTKIVFDTNYSGVPFYTSSDSNNNTYFLDQFKFSEQKEVTPKDVANAVVDVGKDEAKSFIDRIKEFFQNLIDKIFGIFKK